MGDHRLTIYARLRGMAKVAPWGFDSLYSVTLRGVERVPFPIEGSLMHRAFIMLTSAVLFWLGLSGTEAAFSPVRLAA